MARQFNRAGYLDYKYKQLKASAYKRDKGKCVYPKCLKTTKLQLHHIRRWSDFPGLRYELSNVCLLCRYHHRKVTGREDEFAPILLQCIGTHFSPDALKVKYGIKDDEN